MIVDSPAPPVGVVSVLDATTGAELAKVVLPPGITADQIVATCDDDGHELYAAHDGKLVRFAGAKVAWSVAVGSVAGIDACHGPTAIVTASSELGTSLVAIARDTGKPTGRVDGIHGDWPARDGSDRIEISTIAGVARWPRDLSSGEADVELARLPPLGELLAHDAHHWLVRATPTTAAVLDAAGVRAYVPLAERGAVLGEHTILAGNWLGSPGSTERLVGLPGPWRRPLRVPAKHAAVTVSAELRDLPDPTSLDLAHAIARAGTAMYAVTSIAIDSRAIYAITLEHASDDTSHPGLARFELATRTWTWVRADGCGAGAPIGVAIARDTIACAGQASKAATVRATTRDGAASWEWTTDHVDALAAAGDVVLAYDADRLTVLDARDGHVIDRIASDDGAAVRAAVLDVDGMTMVATYEGGRVVGRLPGVAMVPAWSLAVDGVVTAIAAAGDGVLVSLEDGDAYRIDARTGEAVGVAGLDLVWRASGELVTGEAPGGPVPPAKLALPPAKPEVYKPTDLEAAPAIATPWPPPPPMRDSWQYTLYDASGGVRARNDYALEPPIAPESLRGRAAPLVIASGPRLHELLVIDPEHGDPLRRVTLPDDAPTGVAFSAIVDGQPVTGTILAAPLRVVVF